MRLCGHFYIWYKVWIRNRIRELFNPYPCQIPTSVFLLISSPFEMINGNRSVLAFYKVFYKDFLERFYIVMTFQYISLFFRRHNYIVPERYCGFKWNNNSPFSFRTIHYHFLRSWSVHSIESSQTARARLYSIQVAKVNHFRFQQGQS